MGSEFTFLRGKSWSRRRRTSSWRRRRIYKETIQLWRSYKYSREFQGVSKLLFFRIQTRVCMLRTYRHLEFSILNQTEQQVSFHYVFSPFCQGPLPNTYAWVLDRNMFLNHCCRPQTKQDFQKWENLQCDHKYRILQAHCQNAKTCPQQHCGTTSISMYFKSTKTNRV